LADEIWLTSFMGPCSSCSRRHIWICVDLTAFLLNTGFSGAVTEFVETRLP
jgi:hypothetical protein